MRAIVLGRSPRRRVGLFSPTAMVGAIVAGTGVLGGGRWEMPSAAPSFHAVTEAAFTFTARSPSQVYRADRRGYIAEKSLDNGSYCDAEEDHDRAVRVCWRWRLRQPSQRVQRLQGPGHPFLILIAGIIGFLGTM